MMATVFKMMDVSSLVVVETILRRTQTDDIAFLALVFVTGLFYTRYFKNKPDPYHHVWYEKPQATDANAKGANTRDIGLKLEESVSSTSHSQNW